MDRIELLFSRKGAKDAKDFNVFFFAPSRALREMKESIDNHLGDDEGYAVSRDSRQGRLF